MTQDQRPTTVRAHCPYEPEASEKTSAAQDAAQPEPQADDQPAPPVVIQPIGLVSYSRIGKAKTGTAPGSGRRGCSVHTSGSCAQAELNCNSNSSRNEAVWATTRLSNRQRRPR